MARNFGVINETHKKIVAGYDPTWLGLLLAGQTDGRVLAIAKDYLLECPEWTSRWFGDPERVLSLLTEMSRENGDDTLRLIGRSFSEKPWVGIAYQVHVDAPDDKATQPEGTKRVYYRTLQADLLMTDLREGDPCAACEEKFFGYRPQVLDCHTFKSYGESGVAFFSCSAVFLQDVVEAMPG